jgi:hypothetical protein
MVPSIIVPRKSLWHPSAVDESIRGALVLSREAPGHTVPVFHAGEVVGLVRGMRCRCHARWLPLTPAQFSGFDTYDTLNYAVKNGQVLNTFFNFPGIGTQHQWMDAFGLGGGVPPAGGFTGTANTVRLLDNTDLGSMWAGSATTRPGASQTLHQVAYEISIGSRNSAFIVLYDRVATYDGCSILVTSTTLTNGSTPARYVSAGDDGLLVAMVAQATLGATASNLTVMHYTDQAGNTAQAMSAGYTLSWFAGVSANVVAVPNGAGNTSLTLFLPLLGGDTGVRKVEDFQSSATNVGGSVCIVMAKPLGFYCVSSGLGGSNGVVQRRDLSRATFALEKVFTTACLSMFVYCNQGQNIMGKLQFAWN